MTRHALLIGAHTFDDARLRGLRSPAHDVEALAEVLADPDIGAFEAAEVDNAPVQEIRGRVEEFFGGRARDDVLLLYYTGHGIREGDELYLTSSDSSLDDLPGTALSATAIKDCIAGSRSQRVVIVLDCCFSGAFAHRMVPRGGATGHVHVQEFFGGRGLVVLTATNAREYSFEDGRPTGGTPVPSVFTGKLVEGLATGAADGDGDGEITVDEWYQYVFEAVQAERENHPEQQTPCRWVYGAHGRLVVARWSGPRAERPARSVPDPLPLTAARASAVVAVVPALAGGACLWAGIAAWSDTVVALLFLGACLLLAALLAVVSGLFGRTVLTADALELRTWRTVRIPWSRLLAIETRTSPAGVTSAVHRATGWTVRRMTLPAPRRTGPRSLPGFDDEVETLRRWTEMRGSPAPVHHTRVRTPPRIVGLAVLVAAALFAGVDQPWTWQQPSPVPRACGVLDEARAKTLLGMDKSRNPSFILDIDSPEEQRSTPHSYCKRPAVNVIELEHVSGYASLEYTRYSGSHLRPASLAARNAAAAKRAADAQQGGMRISTPERLGPDGYVAVSEGTERAVAARHGTVVVLTCRTDVQQLIPMPSVKTMLAAATDALAAVR